MRMQHTSWSSASLFSRLPSFPPLFCPSPTSHWQCNTPCNSIFKLSLIYTMDLPGQSTPSPQQSDIAATIIPIPSTPSQNFPYLTLPATQSWLKKQLPVSPLSPITEHISQPCNCHQSSISSHSTPSLSDLLPFSDKSLSDSVRHLTQQLMSLSALLKSKSTTKPHTPDVYDGSNPAELDTFIFQCSMYFAAHSAHFPDVETQVAFALISYWHSTYVIGFSWNWVMLFLAVAHSLFGTIPMQIYFWTSATLWFPQSSYQCYGCTWTIVLQQCRKGYLIYNWF